MINGLIATVFAARNQAYFHDNTEALLEAASYLKKGANSCHL